MSAFTQRLRWARTKALDVSTGEEGWSPLDVGLTWCLVSRSQKGRREKGFRQWLTLREITMKCGTRLWPTR